MNLLQRYKLAPLLVTGLACLFVGVLGGIFTPTSVSKMIQLCLAFYFYCIIPGYFLLLTIKLDNIERIVVSTGVSISVVPILLYQFDFLDWKISLGNTIFVIIGCVVIGVVLRERQISSHKRK